MPQLEEVHMRRKLGDLFRRMQHGGWCASSQQQVGGTVHGHIVGMMFSKDRKLIASGSEDKTIKI